jgi:aspartyl aminopeptidase
MNNIENFLDFLKTSTNQYEASLNLEKILLDNGYEKLNEYEKFNLKRGGKYFIRRNSSAVIAFSIPKNEIVSINMSAAHTDSPTFKIKPNNQIVIDGHYNMLNTEVYGGPIYSSFFDRPLSISGRVFIKNGNEIEERLINFDRDLLSIPNECIHFNREVNNGKSYNAQIDLRPMLSINKNLNDLFKEKNINIDDILSFDLSLYSRFRGCVYGADNEFIMAPQIDDLESAYGCLLGFIKANNENSLNVYCAFDNEEVGSQTKQGAGSRFLLETLLRIYNSLNLSSDKLYQALSQSLMVSCDNAHAVHPNDQAKTDQNNKVYMNEGIVIKHNANQAYTTDGLSEAIFEYILKTNNIKYQHFTNRSDVRGGSTLGAISLSNVTIPSVDIGLAQLAMHSCIETAGTKDLDILIDGMKEFYSHTIRRTMKGFKVE